MVRASPVKPNYAALRSARGRAAAPIHRAGVAYLRSFITGKSPEREAKALFDDDRTDLVIKAATTPAAIAGTAAWAGNLGAVSVYDAIADIASQSAAADLIGRGLKLNMDGVAELHVPGRVVDPASAGAWVPEGGALPARKLGFADAAVLRPRKLAVLAAITREMADGSNIEEVVRQTLGEASGLALDLAMFSSFAGDATRPPGLFAGVTPLTPTTGGGESAMLGDVQQLFAALAAAGGGLNAVIVAAAGQAAALKMVVGPQFDTPILASTALAAGTVGVIEAASFVSGFSSAPEFSVSKVSVLHFEDTAPTDITGGTPSPATPVKSLWQMDALGLRMTLSAAFGMRAAGHAQVITATSW
jgi:hypothetical protein